MPRRPLVIASLAALVAAGVAGTTLPAAVFQASAIVAVDEPSVALRLAAARSAATLAVSKPVMMRAATSLNGTVVAAPAPAFAEKLGVVAGLAGATGAVARLAETLASMVTATAGDGLVEIQATAVDGTHAARVATAVGDALIAEEEGSVAVAAKRREISGATRLELLRETARAARARLAALGVPEADPADAVAAAGAATRLAEARLSAIHAVIAAGTPPLGAGSELPQSAAALQQTYWDLKKQLDKASETLGERHITVIALRDGVARAAASLTAEWQRIERAAAGDAAVTRGREAVLRKASFAIDPAKRDAADEARGAVRLADAAVARAAAMPLAAALVNPPFRLVAPASVPVAAVGLGMWQRSATIGGVGAAAFALTLLASARRRDRRSLAGERIEPHAKAPADGARAKRAGTTAMPAKTIVTPETIATPETVATPETIATPKTIATPETVLPIETVAPPETVAPIETTILIEPATLSPAASEPIVASRRAAVGAGKSETTGAGKSEATGAGKSEATHPVRVAAPATEDSRELDYDFFASDWAGFAPREIADERAPAMPFESRSFASEPRDLAKTPAAALDPDLRDALRAIAADFEALAAAQTGVATVMVASNVVGADTGAVALGLAEAAAELGYRILVVEGERAQATLAEAVLPDGEPILVDAFGALRVAMPAERGDGLYLAPALRDGARIAAALARNTEAELFDDLAATFDAVVIDGGRAADSAAAGWSADAFIRVGRFASNKDDAYFLEAFAAPPEALLGTVAAGRFVARDTTPEPQAPARPALRAVQGSLDVAASRRLVPTPVLRAPLRRRIVAR